MQKTDERTLREIESLFEQYKRDLLDADLDGTTKVRYRQIANYFVRWIRGNYTPGHGRWQP